MHLFLNLLIGLFPLFNGINYIVCKDEDTKNTTKEGKPTYQDVLTTSTHSEFHTVNQSSSDVLTIARHYEFHTVNQSSSDILTTSTSSEFHTVNQSSSDILTSTPMSAEWHTTGKSTPDILTRTSTSTAKKTRKPNRGKMCKKPQQEMYKITENNEYYPVNSSIIVSCREDFEPKYSSTSKWFCIERNGAYIWKPDKFNCIPKCSYPNFTDSGIGLYPEHSFYASNSTVNVTCPRGSEPTSYAITCVRRGNRIVWSNTAVSCKKMCTKPPGGEYFTFTPDQEYYSWNASVTVSCKKGYKLFSAEKNYTSKCVEPNNNKWEMNDPLCVETPENIAINVQSTSHSVSVNWTFPNISVSEHMPEICIQCHLMQRYGRQCNAEISPKTSPMDCKHGKNNLSSTFPTYPFSYYNVTLSLRLQNLSNINLLYLPINTTEAAPGKPENVVIHKHKETITWNQLSDCNGTVTGYELIFNGKRGYNDTFYEKQVVNVSTDATSYHLNNLKRGTNYTFELRGRTSAGLGEEYQSMFETNISAPPPPDASSMEVYNISDRTAALSFYPVPDANGPISAYQIIIKKDSVSSQRRKRASDMICNDELYAYNRLQSSNAPYITAEIPGNNLTAPVEFIIGDERNYSGYWNAPLQRGNSYSVIVRIVSRWKEDTKVSCAKKSFLVPVPLKPDPAPGAVLIGGAAGAAAAVFFLLVIILILAIIVYRKQKAKTAYASNKQSEFPLIRKDHAGHTSTDVAIENLLDYMIKMKKLTIKDEENEDVGLGKEYNALLHGITNACDVAKHHLNKDKNRYNNAIPYDYSRVVLDSSDPDSPHSYINASYLDGYDKPDLYIATQGPLQQTIVDFWKMVWQEKSTEIVMLTNLVEQDKVKCEQYWPEETEKYDDITVSLHSTERTVDCVIQSFEMEKNDSQKKLVKHFHFLTWPDHGVPKHSTGLCRLLKAVHKNRCPESGPIIVHCSAGVGRTGTFIALDYLLRRAEVEKKVDVFQCVKKLREKRMNMVQTKTQYVFIYHALLEELYIGETGVPVQDLQKYMTITLQNKGKTSVPSIEKEFQVLMKFSELYKVSSYNEAVKPINKSKNRNHNLLPAEVVRPVLMSVSNSDGSPSYINAVFADSYSQQDGFIITQFPMATTMSEFWALVYDYKCSTLVLMNQVNELDEAYPAFWPETEDAMYGPFCVTKLSHSEATGYSVWNFKLVNVKQKSSAEHQIKLLEINNWPKTHPIPQSPSTLIAMLGEVETWQQKTAQSTVLVACCDGAQRSGLFCAASVICDCIKVEGLVDVFQAVKSIKRSRSQLISDKLQYEFCYQIASSYLDCFETYGNFK